MSPSTYLLLVDACVANISVLVITNCDDNYDIIILLLNNTMHTHRPCLIIPPSVTPSPYTSPPLIHAPYTHLIPHPLTNQPLGPSMPHLNFHSSSLHPLSSIASPLCSASYLQPLIPPPLHPLTHSPFILHRAIGMTQRSWWISAMTGHCNSPEELVDLHYVWPLQLQS